MRRRYQADIKFHNSTLRIIDHAEQICREYAAMGYELTLRQLYYQFVARDIIRNTIQEYKRLGSIINDARLTGDLDWSYIVDRTRNMEQRARWNTPSGILKAARDSYHIDLWQDQRYRPEIWVEKEALVGVVERVANTNDVPYFACRGYVSQSEMWEAGMRMTKHLARGQVPIIFHLGDHDPSGLDMTRDITDRVNKFVIYNYFIDVMKVESTNMTEVMEHIQKAVKVPNLQRPVPVVRLALNMDQIEEYTPPPNPAKVTDARYEAYSREFGEESWELDALDPPTISALVDDAVWDIRDDVLWDAKLVREEEERAKLNSVYEQFLEDEGQDESDDD